MHRYTLKILTALAVAVTLAAGPGANATPTPTAAPITVTAPTHNQNNNSLWYCSWARRYDGDDVVHSKADYLTTQAVRFYCQARSGPVAYQYWVWTGIPVGAYGFIMGSGFQYCYDVNCIEP